MKAENYIPKDTDLVLEDGTIIVDGKLPKPEKRIRVMFPKVQGQKVQEDINVIINGKAWQIQRGKEVEIPESVYEVIKNSQDMQDEADNFIIANANNIQ